MGRERHRPNHYCVEVVLRQYGEDFFRSPQQTIGVTHTDVLAGLGLSHE